MKTIIATDIFGYGEHLEDLCSQIGEISSSIAIVTPYSSQPKIFTCEDEAYQSFLSKCGYEKYSILIDKEISSSSENTLLLGFSAGASSIWNLISTVDHPHLVSFIGFYPSQIRNQLSLSPRCTTTIVFPRSESSFDVAEAASILSKNPNVECHISNYGHGFMNSLSQNYDIDGAQTFSNFICAHLR